MLEGMEVMNRELKFRAWDKLRNRMERFDLGHKDGLLYQDGNWFVATGYDGEDNPTFDDDNVPRRYELMQFTGLKDRHGVEIYEGDIIEITFPREGEGRFEMVFDSSRGGFMAKDDEGLWRLTTGDRANEVIGNVYEHPELLGATERT